MHEMAETSTPLRVADRVWRLTVPLPFRPREVHAYLAQLDHGGFLLVDGGVNGDACWAALDRGVCAVAGDWESVRVHFVTHMHMDHIGLAGRVRAAAAPRLLMSRLDGERAAHASAQPAEEAAYREQLLREHGAPEPILEHLQQSREQSAALQPLVPPDQLLAGRQGALPGAAEWEFVRTSGHTAGHLSLFRPADGTLIAGDAVLPTISPTIGVNRQRADPVADFLAALAHLEQLPIRLVLPGHGNPIAAPLVRLAELRRETVAETERVRDLVTAPYTGWQVSARRYAERNLPTGPAVQALRETLAHLEHLHGWGEIRCAREPDGSVRFFPV